MFFICVYTDALSESTAMTELTDIFQAGAFLQTWEGSFCSTKLKILINAL